MNLEERIERARRYHAQGRIVQGKWGNERSGCLLGIISPEAQITGNTMACPSSVMPRWLSSLVPMFNDSCHPSQHRAFVYRFLAVLPDLHKLGEEVYGELHLFSGSYDSEKAILVLERAVARLTGRPILEVPKPAAVQDANAILEAAVISPETKPFPSFEFVSKQAGFVKLNYNTPGVVC